MIVINAWADKPAKSCFYCIRETPVFVQTVLGKEIAESLGDKPMLLHSVSKNGPLTNFKGGDTFAWSNTQPIPKIGEKVQIMINGLGFGTVMGYFVEHQFVGLEVKLDAQPDWHRKQNGAGKHALVMGAEVAY